MGRITPVKLCLTVGGLLILVVILNRSCDSPSTSEYARWGGKSKEEWLAQKKKRDQQEEAEAAIAAAPPAAKPAAKTPARKQSGSSPAARPSSKQNKPAVVKPKPRGLAEDFTEWSTADYFLARRNNEGRLIGAISYLGKQYPDNKNAVDILCKLLDADSVDAGANAARGPAGRSESKIVEAVVAALAEIDTPEAWHAVGQYAAGKMKTTDDQAAALAAVKALVERPSRDNEDSLLRVVLLGRRSAPAADALETREKILALVKSSASAAFRLRLAQQLASPHSTRELFDELRPCLQEPRPENLLPQVILYQCGYADRPIREQLEPRLAAANGSVLPRLMNIPSDPDRKSDPKTAVPPADGRALAAAIWNDDFASAVEQRLLGIDALSKSEKLLLLAGAIPTHRTRASLRRILELHWEEGPKALESSGFGEDATLEPGFLVAVKTLPRKDPPASAGPAAAARRPANPRAASSKAAALIEARRRQDEIAEAWMKFSVRATQAACRQFRAAAVAPEGDGPSGCDAGDFPLKPHPNAEVVAVYKLSWPENLKDGPDDLSSLPPLRVCYVRIEQRANPAAVLGYYRRQIRAHDEHSLQDGVWFDSLGEGPGKGMARSTDVLITYPNGPFPERIAQEQRLIIEILVIECPTIAG